jgi:hypothetical protein
VNKLEIVSNVVAPVVRESAVQVASGTGGFGNQQTVHAFEKQKIIYKDILLHNLNVSFQEFQKKQKMFQKKVTKNTHKEMIWPPEMQYMNIYKKTANRLPIFEDVSKEFDETKTDEFTPDELTFFGDATSYEKYLESQIKLLSHQDKQEKIAIQAQMQAQEQMAAQY